MGSRFENFNLGRAVAKFLNVKDQKNFPLILNTDELQPVLSIGGPIAAPDTWVSADLVNKSMVGLASWSYACFGATLVGAANDVASPAIFTTTDSMNRGHFIRGISLNLSYDNAGSTADAGKIKQFFGWLYDPTGSSRLVFVMAHPFEIKANLNLYQMAWPEFSLVGQATFQQVSSSKGWNGYVPPGWNFIIQCGWYNISTNFPANTTLNGQVAVSEMPDGFTYNGPT